MFERNRIGIALRATRVQNSLSLADINFPPAGKVQFPSKYHRIVTLSKWKWNLITSKPERSYYRENGEKVATTLINPDIVRHHRTEPNQFIYYKFFTMILLNGVAVKPPGGVFFAVILDVNTSRICTVYPVRKPKPGKTFKPN